MAENLGRLFRMDARHILPEVQCPTLVLHRQGYKALGTEHGRYLASHIPGAVFEEVPGSDAPIYTEGMQAIVARIGRFLGRAPASAPDTRTFATVLFTDIVSSTERAIALGDDRWQEVLDAHDIEIREAVVGHAGRVIKSTGDGVLATFDAPTRALRCAVTIRNRVGPLGIDMRAGLHAGAVLVRDSGDIGGLAVNVAARIVSRAGPGEILTSSSVVDLVTDAAIAFEDRGRHELKGVPEAQRLYAVSVRRPTAAC
jgi:class 3 adenylate cyclase